MKRFAKITILGMMVATMALSTATAAVSAETVGAQAAGTKITTPPSGYTSAEQVSYKKSGKYVKNWGARGEDCVFLTTYAQAFYTGDDVYAKLSQVKGGTSYTNAPQSPLYDDLHSLMESKHSHQTSYQETRDQYAYTDCLLSNSALFSSFYSGTMYDSTWVGGNNTPWNREHCWPNSKCINQNKSVDSADIMMLRPTLSGENSSRGNKAYGESSGYFEPNDSVKGDCARLVLYGYTRWENTGYMWGTEGVMESKEVLLRWMEEDPVDTWEMGRNDAVQAITGTRNVFVDYPEYAWLLFGEQIPKTMVTPSGAAKGILPPVVEETEDDSSNDGEEADGSTEDATDGTEEGKDSTGSEGGDGQEKENTGSGCAASVSLALGSVALAIVGAYVLKRRTK